MAEAKKLRLNMFKFVVLPYNQFLTLKNAKNVQKSAIIQNNVKLLKEHGHHFIGPEDGSLACGEYGSGRLVDPGEILNQLK